MTDNQLTKKEQEKYESIWNIPSYRASSPGYLQTSVFFDFFKDLIKPGDSITDFGSGSGFSTLPFLENNLTVHLIDIASNALDEKITALTTLLPDRITFTNSCIWEIGLEVPPSDWIYCVDVLEHLPTEKIDDSLREIAKRTKKGGLLQIFLQDEPFGQLIGETLHLSIKPLPWWIEKINSHFSILGLAPIIPNVRYTIFVAPKKEGEQNNSRGKEL